MAVQAGGVIPVFSYLIIPPVAAILLVHNRYAIIIISLLISLLGSVFGIYFSIQFDFPAGPSVVTVLGLLFIISGIIIYFKRKTA